MQESTIYIKRIMDTYYKITDTGSFCFDTRLNLVSSLPESLSLQEFSCFGFQKLLSFLAEAFYDNKDDNRYIAYFLHNNIICHVVFLSRNNTYIGAIVTEPIVVKPMSEAEIDSISTQLHIPNLNKTEIHKALVKRKVIPYDRAMSYGTALHSLCLSLFQDEVVPQVLKSHRDINTKQSKPLAVGTKVWNIKGTERHIPSSTYLSIKRAIQEGDTNKILHFVNHESAANAPMYQLHKTDHVRSIKNSFIKLCSMACYTAIDAGAPYVQTLDMADNMVLKMESTDSIMELYEMMKNILLEFTKSVSDSKKSVYSQPVRKIMDYLYSHYSEKITLEDLSNITRLSTYYISNLIKTETGLSLNDNINKIRIEQSQKMLLEKAVNILEIAQSVGFHYQNHFASVFKKYTGMTPSEYRNAHGINLSGAPIAADTGGGESLSLAMQQIKLKLNIFNGFYDAARIVDPLEHISWFLYGNDVLDQELVCYNFWNRNDSCQNCVSMRAYVQNDTFFKLEKKEDRTYLVLAFPEYVGKSVYIAEILKDISKQSIININAGTGMFPGSASGDNQKDPQTGFYTRYYIDKNLPMEIRKSKVENKPLTLLAAVFTLPEKSADPNEIITLLAESALSCLPCGSDWIGHYAGNILFFVLHNTTEEQAGEVSRLVSGKFSAKLNSLGYTGISIHFTEQGLSQEIFEVGELLYLLFAKLYGKVQSDT